MAKKMHGSVHTRRSAGRKSRERGKGWHLPLGASRRADGSVSFRVWAPRCQSVHVKLLTSEEPDPIRMVRDGQDYFSVTLPGVPDGTCYYYVLDGGRKRPDPVSRSQPDGVHGPTEIVSPSRYRWKDAGWKGISMEQAIFYELHIGTFTPEGTFEAAIQKIPYLKELGVTCVEIMPVAQFPGHRNWGYDGVSLFAVQNSYGGPAGLKKLVDACHRAGLAVCLDVVYNHLGPEGNYLHDYGPYFTGHYHTPWGDALNYDGPGSPHVREFIISNALYWVTEYHIDALRLDAVHGIYDFGARHILDELQESVQTEARRLRRRVLIIAESDLNDSRLVNPHEHGGYALDGQWSDDFHHALHVTLTGAKTGYYEDFSGLEDLARALERTFVYDGRYSHHRRRRHGNTAVDLEGRHFVHYSQNHDQVGNRAWGDRLSMQITFEAQKAAAALLLLSPYVPMLWMGQEYGERAPFQYFIDHGDADLVEAVRQGRRKEFESFGWSEIPDPADEETFTRSRLDWTLLDTDRHARLLQLHRDLIRLRRRMKIMRKLGKNELKVSFDLRDQWLSLQYTGSEDSRYGIMISLAETERLVRLPFGGKKFAELLNTEDERYGGFLARSRKREYGREILLSAVSAVAGKIIR